MDTYDTHICIYTIWLAFHSDVESTISLLIIFEQLSGHRAHWHVAEFVLHTQFSHSFLHTYIH